MHLEYAGDREFDPFVGEPMPIEPFEDDDGAVEVLTPYTGFEAVKKALEAAGLKPELAEVTMRADNTVELTPEDSQKMQRLLDALEDLDDTQEVFHNAELSE